MAFGSHELTPSVFTNADSTMNSESKNNPRLKYAIGMGIGMGVGTAIYQMVTADVEGPDFVRALFVGIFGFIGFLVIPSKSAKDQK